MTNKELKCRKKREYVKFKNYERKIKLPFMIYADFESISVLEDNGKHNPEESYTSKYEKHIGCSYDYKLVCVDDKFSKPFKTYLGENSVYNFINNLIEESKCCSDVMKKQFKKELVMTKEDNEDFENSTKCWICDNDYIGNDVKVRYHYHITGKYRASAHRDCNINLKLNEKIPIVFHNLKNYDSHLIMQELGKFSIKMRMCILELSTGLMHEFHYDYIKNKYDNKSKLLFTDTDSLMYEIKTKDVYEDFSSNKEMFDLSNY